MATAFVGGTIVDGRGGAPIAEGVLVVDGDRIEAVGHRDEDAVYAEDLDLAYVPDQARSIRATSKLWVERRLETR